MPCTSGWSDLYPIATRSSFAFVKFSMDSATSFPVVELNLFRYSRSREPKLKCRRERAFLPSSSVSSPISFLSSRASFKVFGVRQHPSEHCVSETSAGAFATGCVHSWWLCTSGLPPQGMGLSNIQRWRGWRWLDDFSTYGRCTIWCVAYGF